MGEISKTVKGTKRYVTLDWLTAKPTLIATVDWFSCTFRNVKDWENFSY